MSRHRSLSRSACAVLLGAALVLSACSSGKSTATPPLTVPPSADAGQTPANPPSEAPTTEAPVTPTPSASPRPTAKPLSKFENDPAVKAMRVWAAQAARTVNTGHYDSAALDKLMTPAFARSMKHVLGVDVGLHYPGPIPVQPLSISVESASHRTIRACSILDGFAVDPVTSKPGRPRDVGSAAIPMQLVKGRWLVAEFLEAPALSCKGVVVAVRTW